MASPYLAMRPVRKFFQRLLWRLAPPRCRPTEDDRQLGLAGENAAARFLQTQGYKILVRRYRCKHGEIDLVCRDGEALVFVEVKSREDNESARPSDAVQLEKQRHMSRCALDYLRRLQNPDVEARFDVVEVLWAPPLPTFELIQDAFPLSEPYYY